MYMFFCLCFFFNHNQTTAGRPEQNEMKHTRLLQYAPVLIHLAFYRLSRALKCHCVFNLVNKLPGIMSFVSYNVDSCLYLSHGQCTEMKLCSSLKCLLGLNRRFDWRWLEPAGYHWCKAVKKNIYCIRVQLCAKRDLWWVSESTLWLDSLKKMSAADSHIWSERCTKMHLDLICLAQSNDLETTGVRVCEFYP